MQINTKIKKYCKICNKVFFVIRSRRDTAKYCSNVCHNKSPKQRLWAQKLGYASKGRHKTQKWLKQASLDKLGPKNPLWKGNDAGLRAIHIYVQRRLKRARWCQNCGKVPPQDMANISQTYKRDLFDWKWLCRRCHMIEDGRLRRLSKLIEKRKLNLKDILCSWCKKSFKPKERDTKFCSLSCTSKYGNSIRWNRSKKLNKILLRV